MKFKANGTTLSAFDAERMDKYWTLENEFLAAFSCTEHDLDLRRNQLLLSAVMFGGLLDSNIWKMWIAAVMGPLRKLAKDKSRGEKRLSFEETRSVQIGFYPSVGRRWFADPLTQNLLSRPLQNAPERTATKLGSYKEDIYRYADLLRLDECAFLKRMREWVLPAATAKARLHWPSLVVEHCSGALTSTGLVSSRWGALERTYSTAKRTQIWLDLDYIRTVRPAPSREPSTPVWFKDARFHYIRVAIQEAIKHYDESEKPTLASEQKMLKALLIQNQGPFPKPNSFGGKTHEWFIKYCTGAPHTERRAATPKRARTLADIAFSLGVSVDWSSLWPKPLAKIQPEEVRDKLYAALKKRPEGFGAARRFYSFLGFGLLPRPEWLAEVRRSSRIKTKILTRPDFDALLARLVDRNGRRGAHWLAAMLMFRCGLRPREIVALEIDHITVVDDLVELKVAATPYVALKNKTSARTLPLHALLSPEELGEVLKWRALRIRDCKGERKHARLLFATIYHPDDYRYLLDPIEDVIRIVTGQKGASEEVRKTPSYVFARCSILRHSFVSYAVASMLYPRDDGGFEMPAGITPDLVSLTRRERLERALLSDGHFGLSSLEAVRQMTGHARYQRTIGTYTHLMDLVAGVYAWRRSFEPALPATVLCQLSERKSGDRKRVRSSRANYAIDLLDTDPALNERTLSYYARELNAAEYAQMEAAVGSLRKGEALKPLVIPRTRRPRGKEFPDWMPKGNAFLSQLRPSTPLVEADCETPPLPEWRRDEIDDWRTADQIVQMASRGVPARLVADEVGVRLERVKWLVERYHRLLNLRRRETTRGNGKLRHGILLEEPEAYAGSFYANATCWYAPLKRVRPVQAVWSDGLWEDIVSWRQQPGRLPMLHRLLARHQDGTLRARKNAQLAQISSATDDLIAVERKASKRAAAQSASQTFRLRINSAARPDLHLQASQIARRAVTAPDLKSHTLIHLCLLAEALASNELPSALTTSPAKSGQTDVAGIIQAFKDRKAEEANEAEERAEREKVAAERSAHEANILRIKKDDSAVLAAARPNETRSERVSRQRRNEKARNRLKTGNPSGLFVQNHSSEDVCEDASKPPCPPQTALQKAANVMISGRDSQSASLSASRSESQTAGRRPKLGLSRS